MRAWAGYGLEVWQRVERQIYFAGRAAVLVTVHIFRKFAGQRAFVEKFREGEARIDTRRDDVGINLIAVDEDNARGLAILNNNLRNRGLRADFNPGSPRC